MDSLSTSSEEESEEERQAQSMHAFIEVLDCSNEEAHFYLESVMWDVPAAVVLWLENNPTRYDGDTQPRPDHQQRPQDLWVSRNVVIDGLNPEWNAFVDSRTGRIYFQHLPTGIVQKQVPPGFADKQPAILPTFEQSQIMGDTGMLKNDNDDNEQHVKHLSTFEQSQIIGDTGMLENENDGDEQHVKQLDDNEVEEKMTEQIFNCTSEYNMLPA
jgi:hypothetical protein